MAGKKNSGFGTLKDTTGGNRRDDRQVAGKTAFEPITIDAKNALTVIYMLKSPEENVVLRAIASLEGFARKSVDNMKLLASFGIFEFLLPNVHHSDNIVKRFSQKLIGMLCGLEEFREQMLNVNDMLRNFVDILENETDVVMHEYAALTLAELSLDHRATSELLKVENCIDTLFLRITSPDPDVEKNCLDNGVAEASRMIMNHLLSYIDGVEAFVESPSFETKLLLELLTSSYPVIQALAIEVLKQLTSWCRDTRVHVAFRNDLGIEMTLGILENDEWKDLHLASLDLLLNVVDNPDMCEYLLQSGCLLKLTTLLDKTEDRTSIEKILGVLARMSQTKKGKQALHEVEMEKRFIYYLREMNESTQGPACLGIANLAQYMPSMDNIINENPIPILLDIVISAGKKLNLRTLAAYALNILCNEDRRAAEGLVDNENLESLFSLLKGSSLPVELCKNVIQVFVGVSLTDNLRTKIIGVTFIEALLTCLCSGDNKLVKNPSLQVEALGCLSVYMTEWQARSIFDSLNGSTCLLECLHSNYASVREWAGHLVVLASQSQDFVRSFIQKGGLDWLLGEKNTMHVMPSWQTAIEAIFANYLPAKFAHTGRLDFQDITQSGFYIMSNPRVKFMLLDDVIEAGLSPTFPIYVANFEDFSNWSESDESTTKSTEGSTDESKSHHLTDKSNAPQNLQKYMKGADRNSLEQYKWTGSINTYSSVGYASKNKESEENSGESPGRYLSDPFLSEYLENLKRRMAKEESFLGDTNWFSIHPKLVQERARIIAEFVADEMSGTDPEPINGTYKDMYINEMKFYLGTNILPLGYIRIGDYLERAMLFKVLADRIGFPCSLVRGKHGRAWIEIAVPVIDIDEGSNTNRGQIESSLDLKPDSPENSQNTISATEETVPDYNDTWFPKLTLNCFKAFPNNLTRPNAIVDLTEVPGRLLHINSFEAEEYCGAFLFESCKHLAS